MPVYEYECPNCGRFSDTRRGNTVLHLPSNYPCGQASKRKWSVGQRRRSKKGMKPSKENGPIVDEKLKMPAHVRDHAEDWMNSPPRENPYPDDPIGPW